MAETEKATTVEPTPAAAPAATPLPSTPKVVGDAGRSDAEVNAEAFGETAVVETPLEQPKGAAEKKPGEQPGAEKDKAALDGEGEPGEETKDTSKPELLPFDDEFAGLVPLDGKPGGAETLPDLSTPEAIKKACNPDGKASAEQQLEHAQQLLGKHSGKVAQAEKIANTFAPFLTKNESTGEYTGFDVVAIGTFLGRDRVEAQLAAIGQKMVPLEWEPKQAEGGDNSIGADGLTELAKMPGLDAETKAALLNPQVSWEDKLALVRGNEDLRLEAKLMTRERSKRQLAARQGAEQGQVQSRNTRLEQLAAKDKMFSHLLNESTQGKKDAPLDKAFQLLALTEKDGTAVAEVLYRLAKYERLSNSDVRKAQSDAIYKRAEADLMKKFKLTMPGAGGGGILPAGGGGGSAEDAEVFACK